MPVSSALALIGFVGLCLLTGAVGSSMAMEAMRNWYPTLSAPPGTPATGLVGAIWLLLYIMIGTAAWLVWKRRGASWPLRLWGWQIAANALCAPTFFGLHSPRLALGALIVLLILTALTIRAFMPVHRLAGLLMLPYLGYCVFTAYLTAGFWVLNPA